MKNPTKEVKIEKDILAIDIGGVSKSLVYGDLGKIADGSTSIINKLNYTTEYTYNEETGDAYYTYNKETDDTYYKIEQTPNMGSATVNDKRQIDIGSKKKVGNKIVRILDGNKNIDDIYVDDFYYNFGNSERYSDHDLGIDSKSGALIQTGSHTIKHPETGEEIKLTDDLNTSNTMTKTMDYYNVVVKPMYARDL
jgi:hypothetical protein